MLSYARIQVRGACVCVCAPARLYVYVLVACGGFGRRTASFSAQASTKRDPILAFPYSPQNHTMAMVYPKTPLQLLRPLLHIGCRQAGWMS